MMTERNNTICHVLADDRLPGACAGRTKRPWREPRGVAPAVNARIGAVLLAAAAVLLVPACAAPRVDTDDHPVWPAPPAPPRFVHRLNIRHSDDVGTPNLFDRIGSAIAGRTGVALLRPAAVATDHADRLYVTDIEQQCLIILNRKNSKSTVVRKAGEEYLVSPVGLAFCGDRLALSDSVLKKVFFFTLDGRLIGALPTAFARPTGLYYHAATKQLYVVDTTANCVVVCDAQGRQVRRVGESGTGPGQLNSPTHVFVDATPRLYVTDSLNFRVQVFDDRGRYMTHIGKLGDASGYLGVPKGVVVDSFGHIYVADSYFNNLQAYDPQGRLLLHVGGAGEKSGRFHLPTGVYIEPDNTIYVCDSYNSRVQVFQYLGGANGETHDPQIQAPTEPVR